MPGRVESNVLFALDLFIHAGSVHSAIRRSIYRYWDHGLGGGTRAHWVLAGWWYARYWSLVMILGAILGSHMVDIADEQ